MSMKLNAWIEADTLPLGMAALHAIKAEVDADNEAHASRIAELTKEVEDWKTMYLDMCEACGLPHPELHARQTICNALRADS